MNGVIWLSDKYDDCKIRSLVGLLFMARFGGGLRRR